MLTLAYDKNGNLLWNRSISSTNPSKDAKGRDIKAEATFDGHLYVTGKLDKGSDHDYVTASYTQDGDLRWLKMFDDTTGSDDKAIDIALDAANNPIVSGICVKDTNTKYVSVKYEQWEVNTTFVTDTLGFPIYAANQLLIKFSPSVVNADFVDNKDVMFASLTNVIADSVIDAINLKLNYDISRSIAVKVFKRMTTRDSISISRLGDTVRMEPTWSEFLITGLTELNLQNAADSLDSLGYSLVEFAEPNYVYYFHSVDTYIDSQASLTPNVTFNDANINIEPAWSIETGKSYIKVGVIDGSIDFTHEDFGDGTYFGSKIAGGWNFYHNLHASQVTKPSVHGTACAGIIGALRRNGKGIAGIAGGDMDNANAGVQLFSLGIAKSGFYRDTFSTLNVIADAIQEGAAYNPNTGYGYGLHIQSNSWGGGANSNSLYNAIVSCSQNRCVFVASRGNFYNGSNPSGTTVTSMNYPACYDDDLVINVGASGNNGMHKTNSNGDATYESMYDNGVDLIAPGSLDIVLTTCATGFPGYSHAASGIPLFSDTTYTRFSGTSSACPHVAGAAGLLLSRHHVNQGYPNNLDPDDIQHLLKTYTTPAGSDYSTYYGGSGNDALTAITAHYYSDLPDYRVYLCGEATAAFPQQDQTGSVHYRGTFGTNPGQQNEGILLGLNSDNTRYYATYYGCNGQTQPTDIICHGNRVYLTGTVNKNGIPVETPIGYFTQPTNATNNDGKLDGFVACFTDGIALNWSTFIGGTQKDIPTAIAHDNTQKLYIVGGTNSKQTATPGDGYPLFDPSNGAYFQNFLNPILIPPVFEFRRDAFITQFDLNPSITHVPETEPANGLLIYPNPASNSIRVALDEASATIESIQIVNLLGQQILQPYYTKSEISISTLPQGMYVLKIRYNGTVYAAKFIKQ